MNVVSGILGDTPHTLPPVPRTVRVRRWPNIGGRFFFTIFLLPFLVLNVFTWYWTACTTVVYFSGSEFPGEVISLAPARQIGSRIVRYNYLVGNRTMEVEATVDDANHLPGSPDWGIGTPITVRAISLFPQTCPIPSFERISPRFVANKLFGGWIVAFVFSLLPLFIVSSLWRDVLAERRLVIAGKETTGRIIAKHISHGMHAGPSYFVRYSVNLPESVGVGGMSVSAKDFAAIRNHAPVTVLYDPKRPTNSTVYEMSTWSSRTPTSSGPNNSVITISANLQSGPAIE